MDKEPMKYNKKESIVKELQEYDYDEMVKFVIEENINLIEIAAKKMYKFLKGLDTGHVGDSKLLTTMYEPGDLKNNIVMSLLQKRVVEKYDVKNNSGASMKTYLQKCINNICKDFQKEILSKKRNLREVYLEWSTDSEFNQYENCDGKARNQGLEYEISKLAMSIEMESENKILFQEILERMPEKHKFVFVKRFYEGWNNAEIAEAMNVSARRVSTWVREAKTFFRRALTREYLREKGLIQTKKIKEEEMIAVGL